jgi:hypothetical protein
VTGECCWCRESGRRGVPASFRLGRSTIICRPCWATRGDGAQPAQDLALPQRAWRPEPTRLRRAWRGGASVLDELISAGAGHRIRLEIPVGVLYDRMRGAIYQLARARGMRVSIARAGRTLEIRCSAPGKK